MITGKQRSYLKGLAQKIQPTVFIGKAGLTSNILTEIDNYLTAHELVKIKLQEGADLNAKETANETADILKAEFVQAIGKTFTLYRESEDNKQIQL